MAILLYKWLWTVASVLIAPNSSAETASTLHPVYVSVTDVNHNVTDKTIEISCKIFTDDFEKGIAETLKKRVDLIKPANQEEANRLVKEYIVKHLNITADGKLLNLEFVGFEHERDVVWSYFQVSNLPNPPKRISVKNNILYETYESQINMMHVTVGGKRKSYKVSNPEADMVFEF
ncbi:DUF6702 family protein [Pseudoflavitalea rhizosphaerae]|uniref:DUF6702 family protein n=1 Tax=Pseudoflavitalea rhizosphaerae TaxID=1884793 RepID=UPI000F8D427F|nr:DUF6702 family protein [Pseudoflavitalea rhizosphaerae]